MCKDVRLHIFRIEPVAFRDGVPIPREFRRRLVSQVTVTLEPPNVAKHPQTGAREGGRRGRSFVLNRIIGEEREPPEPERFEVSPGAGEQAIYDLANKRLLNLVKPGLLDCVEISAEPNRP